MKNYSNTASPAEILFLTSYPPRECGIATYSQDLIKSIQNKFGNSLTLKVCALEAGELNYIYPQEVIYVLNTSDEDEFGVLASNINKDKSIKIVLIQHEFGFFQEQEAAFKRFISTVIQPVVIVFHTVLPHPGEQLRQNIREICENTDSIVVMTRNSAQILVEEYGIPLQQISVIAHGTHLVPHLSEQFLKQKYGLTGKTILTTFGLLSKGKSIETTINALPEIVAHHPEVIFLVIGKTHPEVKKREGEEYRNMLEKLVVDLSLQVHVIFINDFLSLPVLLEYLQLTDIYVFSTNDPNQAVSGTFAYAMSCACPIISTPIPHAREFLTGDTGIIFDFGNSDQLADGVLKLLNNVDLRRNISSNTLQKIVATAWENSAVSHAMLFETIRYPQIQLTWDLPPVNLNHLDQMTTVTGIIQFSRINQPDKNSGYTLDDNARALIAMCMYFNKTGNVAYLSYIRTYLRFIWLCQLPSGVFLNYVDVNERFTNQNSETNLDDSNGRAVWALGYTVSLNGILPADIVAEAELILKKALSRITVMHSTRAMAFVIKGIYYYNRVNKSVHNLTILKTFARRLVQMYRHESNSEWEWYEGYLTYANSILPEAMLYAWLLTGEPVYKNIARSSFDFLLSQTFNENGIEVISNKHWLHQGETPVHIGEQPIDVAYTIMTLSKFYDVFGDEEYKRKMEKSFNWFLGDNRLHQIIYNPCTGGCYDGLEETHVNLNQGAESTVSYLLARLTMERYINIRKTLRLEIPEPIKEVVLENV